jgi:hypothetical protein
LSPQEFHDILSSNRDHRRNTLITADSCPELDVASNKSDHLDKEIKEQELILLDVRNYYETRVGRFQLQDNSGEIVGSAIDPRTRQVRNVRIGIPTGSHYSLNSVSQNLISFHIAFLLSYSIIGSSQTSLNSWIETLRITWGRKSLCTAQVSPSE